MKIIRVLLLIVAYGAAANLFFMEITKENIVLFGAIIIVSSIVNIFVHRRIIKKQTLK